MCFRLYAHKKRNSEWKYFPLHTQFIFLFVKINYWRLSCWSFNDTIIENVYHRLQDEFGTGSGMRIGRGDQNIRKTPSPVPLCSPQTHMTWPGIDSWGSASGTRRLTAWAMEWPYLMTCLWLLKCIVYSVTADVTNIKLINIIKLFLCSVEHWMNCAS
jgi:hypothetical protein